VRGIRGGEACKRRHLLLAAMCSLVNSPAHSEFCIVAKTRRLPYAAQPLPVFHSPGSSSDQSYLSEAYNQIKLYRNHLKSDSGAWKHIVLGP
jgi:hypothetical protein